MPEILIATCPPVGNISPLLNVARGLVARGDRVTVLTSARHADKIRAVGAERRAVRKVLHEPGFRVRAGQLRTAYAGYDSVAEIARLVDEVVGQPTQPLRSA